jgi:hypothetical protein
MMAASFQLFRRIGRARKQEIGMVGVASYHGFWSFGDEQESPPSSMNSAAL